MRLRSGKRIGQSGYELTLAVFFSFFLHAAIIAAALFISMAVAPRIFIPPYYSVKLVGLPADVSGNAPLSPKEAAPPAPAKQQPTAKMPAHKQAKAAPTKGRMPELLQHAPKKAQPEPAHEEPAVQQPVARPAAPAGKPGGTSEGVGIPTPLSQDFKSGDPYLSIVREKIQQNWNPPPGVTGTKSKVLFSILRSGRVGDVKLAQSSGNFYFDQAAMRAILLSSPFPPMPEGFYKEYAEFSVDLMENE